MLPITGDNISDLKSQISNAVKSSDILITTGGVSVGKYDLTKATLTELGAEIFFERVRLKPGKPTVFARLKKTLVFGLPGNPVSAAVTYYLFVRKAILQMQGATETDIKRGNAIAIKPVKAPKERDAYLPATISTDTGGRLLAEPVNWRGSSDFIGFARAEALIVIMRGKSFDSGECVKILYLQ
jgi:molybdopterin biosynthesis enzyme